VLDGELGNWKDSSIICHEGKREGIRVSPMYVCIEFAFLYS